MGSEASLRGHRAADLPRKLLNPRRTLFEHPDDCWMSGQRGCALSFKRGTAQECASLERGTIRCELEQGRARARARSEESRSR